MMFAKGGRRRLQARRRLTIQVQQARNAPADKIVVSQLSGFNWLGSISEKK